MKILTFLIVFLGVLLIFGCGKEASQQIAKDATFEINVWYYQCQGWVGCIEKTVEFFKENPAESETNAYEIMFSKCLSFKGPLVKSNPGESSLDKMGKILEQYDKYSNLDNLLKAGVGISAIHNELEEFLSIETLKVKNIKEFYDLIIKRYNKAIIEYENAKKEFNL